MVTDDLLSDRKLLQRLQRLFVRRMRIYLYETQMKSGDILLYAERKGGPRRRVWAHVDVYFADKTRKTVDWDLFLLGGERLPLVPLHRYRGWSYARLTLPDGEENYALQTQTYIENTSCDTS